ncbi:MAG: hypothetical protein A3E87_04435 [Gammaproteobacteria bacterium RIFCSPHIGHO2_12_FULL_35_23]|nr:MAG: hypothetical protein A3E87_04435 [Gammaproteobacteria bacterium RIFCSPHIGHO2_12_FULL_35_23]
MKKFGLTILLLSVLSLSTYSVLAETAITKGAFSLTPFASYYSFSSKRHLKSGGGLGLGLAYYFNNNWATELSGSEFATKQSRLPEKSVDGQYITLNGLYYFRSGMGFRPYLSAGIGASHFSRNSNNNPSTQGNVGVGGGVIYFIDQSIALRAGANDYYNLTGSGNNDVALQGGVSFYFGDRGDESSGTSTEEAAQETAENVYVLPDESETNASDITTPSTTPASSAKQKQAFIAAAAIEASKSTPNTKAVASTPTQKASNSSDNTSQKVNTNNPDNNNLYN